MLQRVQFKVWISKDVDERFRNLIMDKYKRYERGLLSYEAEQALKSWVAMHTRAQKSGNQPKRVNPTPRVIIAFTEARDYLLRKYYDEITPGQQIPRVFLEEAIMATRGSDPRTIRKWFRVFERMGLIKEVTPASWKVM